MGVCLGVCLYVCACCMFERNVGERVQHGSVFLGVCYGSVF